MRKYHSKYQVKWSFMVIIIKKIQIYKGKYIISFEIFSILGMHIIVADKSVNYV